MCSLLWALAKWFGEADVALMFVLLHSVGLQLRGADPARMKVRGGGGGSGDGWGGAAAASNSTIS
jgi:hypothetical protein